MRREASSCLCSCTATMCECCCGAELGQTHPATVGAYQLTHVSCGWELLPAGCLAPDLLGRGTELSPYFLPNQSTQNSSLKRWGWKSKGMGAVLLGSVSSPRVAAGQLACSVRPLSISIAMGGRESVLMRCLSGG